MPHEVTRVKRNDALVTAILRRQARERQHSQFHFIS